MISHADIQERAREWSLREDVVEKDYVLGWVLWGIGADDVLGDRWAFKGGTCLKKCFLETYRFSEDLDFTVDEGGPVTPEELVPPLARVLERVADESGIDFSRRAVLLKGHTSGRYTEGRIYYVGPRRAPEVASIRLDVSASEKLARPTVRRPIAHPYPDALPEPATVQCYCFEEVFAEKIRALGERGRPRDVYDVVNLHRRQDPLISGSLVAAVLREKCQSKGVPIPTATTVLGDNARSELESEWESMLGHQLPALPPLADFIAALPAVFEWLAGAPRVPPAPIAVAAAGGDRVDTSWSPPANIQVWHTRIPLEGIRFAAVNHLLVDLRYNGTWRAIEPYSLRRSQAGNFLLHATRSDTGDARSYRVDRIEDVRLTSRSFAPRFAIEFSPSGPMSAPAIERAPRRRGRRA